MEQENQKEASPAPAPVEKKEVEKKEVEKKEECGESKCCIGNYIKNIGLGYNEHKLAYHIVGGIAVSVVAFHLYTKYRSSGHCCH